MKSNPKRLRTTFVISLFYSGVERWVYYKETWASCSVDCRLWAVKDWTGSFPSLISSRPTFNRRYVSFYIFLYSGGWMLVVKRLMKGKNLSILSTYWLNLGWVLMSWVSHRLRDQDNCCIHLSGLYLLVSISLISGDTKNKKTLRPRLKR